MVVVWNTVILNIQEEILVGLQSVERIKEFIRRGQRQKQAGEEVWRMCWEDEEDMSTVVGLRRMITCPTATKGTEI